MTGMNKYANCIEIPEDSPECPFGDVSDCNRCSNSKTYCVTHLNEELAKKPPLPMLAKQMRRSYEQKRVTCCCPACGKLHEVILEVEYLNNPNRWQDDVGTTFRACWSCRGGKSE